MFNHVLRLSAAAAMLSAVPAIASAETLAYGMTAPVALESFTIHEYDTTEQNGDGTALPHYVASGLTLDFVNRNNVPATGVTFLLTDGKHAQRIVDKGTFSQGVSISHTYDIDDGFSEPDDAIVEVTDVDFADGGAWHAQSGNSDEPVRVQQSSPARALPAGALPASAPTPREQNDAAERQRLFRHLGTSV